MNASKPQRGPEKAAAGKAHGLQMPCETQVYNGRGGEAHLIACRPADLQHKCTLQAACAHLPLKGNWTGGHTGESMNGGRVSPCSRVLHSSDAAVVRLSVPATHVQGPANSKQHAAAPSAHRIRWPSISAFPRKPSTVSLQLIGC